MQSATQVLCSLAQSWLAPSLSNEVEPTTRFAACMAFLSSARRASCCLGARGASMTASSSYRVRSHDQTASQPAQCHRRATLSDRCRLLRCPGQRALLMSAFRRPGSLITAGQLHDGAHAIRVSERIIIVGHNSSPSDGDTAGDQQSSVTLDC